MNATSTSGAAGRLGNLAAIFFLFCVAGAADYPEAAKLPPQAGLPDVLVAFDGRPVTTRQQWVSQRRPELKSLFEHYMYGTAPPPPAQVTAVLEREDRNCLGGKATKKEVAITFGPPGVPKIHLLLVVPNARKRPAPVFVGVNFSGNHAVLSDPTIALPTAWVRNGPAARDNRATEAGRGMDAQVWMAEMVIDRGYALATFFCGDVALDHPGHADGLHPFYPGFDWGTIAAWAWGLSRAADYLETDPDIDRAAMVVLGHSRMGKAALLAGAFDERFAVVIPLQAGCGGSAPSRGKIGESVEQINRNFPHWFNASFKTFSKEPERLPFDQHALVALVAPRPVLFSNAVDDTHANPAGQFEVLKAAEPVYRLLGAGGLDATVMPEPNKLVDSTLGYVIRPGKHSMRGEDWVYFLEFAHKHLGRTQGR